MSIFLVRPSKTIIHVKQGDHSFLYHRYFEQGSFFNPFHQYREVLKILT